MDWPTVASLGTAFGTLVLAFATFDAVRSANRATRLAEASLQARIRPLLLSTRMQDPPEKVMWADQHFARVEGGRGVLEQDGDAIYLAGTVRNAGSGLAVLHGWYAHEDWRDATHPPPPTEKFRMLTRDLYIAPGDIGFFQGGVREVNDPFRVPLEALVKDPQRFAFDLLYGDQEGGQHTVTRFGFTPHDGAWLVSTSRHWFLDRHDPR